MFLTNISVGPEQRAEICSEPGLIGMIDILRPVGARDGAELAALQGPGHRTPSALSAHSITEEMTGSEVTSS